MPSPQKPNLTVNRVHEAARRFAIQESGFQNPALYGISDGKAVGTYIEHKFRDALSAGYSFSAGNTARGIDFPEIGVDVKTTSIRQPQSSCPFKSARQKVYGLGYSLLIFVYDKNDDHETKSANLDMQHVIYVDGPKTADFQTTSGINEIIRRKGNADDLIAFFQDRFLPVDDIQAERLAKEVLETPPDTGYLTISNALQWRLQYSRVIEKAGAVEGIVRVK